ncbi:hypothetical protein KY336_00190 [Candidatus Woesearchaeota archaeon]|nr:hypothetical protein [Candidatus Woesearchaeota archaeon]
MTLDDNFDSEQGGFEKKLTDSQTREDEKAILKHLANKCYNTIISFYNTAVETVNAAPKALLYDLPIGLTKLAAATVFQAIPMWPNHRKRVQKYLGAEDSGYMYAGSVLQVFGEAIVAFSLLSYGTLNHSDPIKNISVVLGADVACKFLIGLNEISGLSGDESLSEEIVMNGWGHGLGFMVGGVLYMAGSTAKDLFVYAKEEYKQCMHKIAAKLQAPDEQQ